MIKVDLCSLDAYLANQIYEMIRATGLSFAFPLFNTSMNVLPAVSAANGQISAQFAEAYLRIKAIFIMFGTSEFNNESNDDKNNVLNETNAFFWPARTDKSTDTVTY